MKWIKLGRIFEPKAQYDWCVTHAMLPVADRIGEDLYRIYFSGRNKDNQSLISYVEIDINEPTKILNISPKPVLGLGKLGCFDGNGVSPTWIVNKDGLKYLYYMGWSGGANVRASEVSGLSLSLDGGKSFYRCFKSPILHRTNKEPYLIAVISCVLREGQKWRMWYDSADEWQSKDLPRYNIKYAESQDGINWIRNGIVSIDYKSKLESRISRACVIKDDIYQMWYCFALNDNGYRMGYAESKDGIKFERMDNIVGIDVSKSGWDSEMICYPHVFDHQGKRYMLYCGNGYGKTGFGMAVLE